MKHKFIYAALFRFVFILFYIPSSYPADPTFNFYLANVDWDSHKVYEFDILIQCAETNPIILATLTLGFTIPNGSLISGNVTATWMSGSTKLSNTAQILLAFNTTTVYGSDSSA